MNDLQKDYCELLALTQLYILREHGIHKKLVTDPSSLQYFRPWQSQNPQNSVSPSVGKEAPSNKNIPYTPPTSITRSPITSQTPQLNPKQNIDEKNNSPQQPLSQSQPQYPTPAPKNPQTIEIKIPSQEIAAISPKTAETKPIKGSIHSFSLEPFAKPQKPEFDDISNNLKKAFPHFSIRDQIPSDENAQKFKNAWLYEQLIPPIILLSFNDQDKHLAFLKNIASAISLSLAPARVIAGPAMEQEKKWDQILNTPALKLVIASDYGLYLMPELMKYYKEQTKTAKHFLHQTPLLLLSDLSLYLKEPQLKPLLWRAICTEFNASCKINLS
ncbi:MAG: hypothetical protein H0W88_10615 [Parachlamydiaceae bacterium]|nr:hypothetical protein [Parachlamydiaceae bacterium]